MPTLVGLSLLILPSLPGRLDALNSPLHVPERAAHSAPLRNRWSGALHSAVAHGPARSAPSIFCFMVIRPNTYEAELLKLHVDKGLLSGCDGHEVYSNVTADRLLGGGEMRMMSTRRNVVVSSLLGPMETHTIENKFAPTCPRIACNTNLFRSVWADVIRKGRHRQFDWIVKLDADTVFSPGRLRQVLQRRSPQEPVFLMNQRYPGGPDELTGAIEVYSRGAVKALGDGMHRCPWPSPAVDSEDQHMYHCLAHVLRARSSSEPVLLSPLPLGGRVAVHPVKDRARFARCVERFDTCIPDLLCIPDSLKALLAPKT